MTEKQLRHIESICATFTMEATEKYKKGVEEHGGNLWDMSALQLVNEALKEAIDQVVYLTTLRTRIINLQNQVGTGKVNPSPDSTEKPQA